MTIAERMVPGTTPQDMLKSRSWTGRFLSEPGAIPLSFLYEGKKITGIPADWAPTRQIRRIDASIRETIFEGIDPRTGLHLQVECLDYLDYPVVEWTAWLTNRGSERTPLIQDLRALDAGFEGASATVHSCNGDFNSADGYTPQETSLSAGEVLSVAPDAGRPCDKAFPYFRISFDGCGMTVAVGWPAQWSATFEGTEQGIAITAGQELTHLQLLPGERIRTPRITILSWVGTQERAINLWRRWYLDHILPRPAGQPLQPLLTAAGTDDGEEFTAATEENQLRYTDAFKRAGFPYDVWWIDAGWYPCYNEEHQRKWVLTGTWEPDPERFPRGLRPVSDNVTKNGADFLLWFEPERVAPDTWLYNTHPEWLLKIPQTEERYTRWALLNLGNAQCRTWLTNYYCTLIQENGVKIYRQDFNFPPLRYWRENEAEDRQGLNENLHVQGYLQFWDDLLTRNPGLWIDSCSSGGRRNDLETMRRSVPLHYTDYGYGIHPVKLAFHHTLYSWIPYFRESTLSWDVSSAGATTKNSVQLDSFSFHCGMAAMLSVAVDIRNDEYDYALTLKLVAIWRRASEMLLNGDYYPLTPFSKSGERWVAWQFDRPETGVGFIQGIRHTACPDEKITLFPKTLEAAATYHLDNPETGETRTLSGATLTSEGITLELPPRSGVLWFYRKA